MQYRLGSASRLDPLIGGHAAPGGTGRCLQLTGALPTSLYNRASLPVCFPGLSPDLACSLKNCNR